MKPEPKTLALHHDPEHVACTASSQSPLSLMSLTPADRMPHNARRARRAGRGRQTPHLLNVQKVDLVLQGWDVLAHIVPQLVHACRRQALGKRTQTR